MAQSIPLQTFKTLEKEFGQSVAEKVTALLDYLFSQADKKVEQIAIKKKLELKDELSKELASKADLALVKTELQSEVKLVKSELKSEMRLYFVILLSVMIILNKDSLTFIAQLLGLLK
jgi:hypothetical protein